MALSEVPWFSVYDDVMSTSSGPTCPPFKVEERISARFVEVTGYVPPLSLQAAVVRKRPYMAALREAVSSATSTVMTGDVKIQIDWYIDQHNRYSTNKVADIDNIVKPILDSVSGNEGILIDDGQVQAIDVRWLDKLGVEEDFRVRFEPLAFEGMIARESLAFAEFSSSRCFPIQTNLDVRARTLILTSVKEQLAGAEYLAGMGVMQDLANATLPIQRFFPTSRLRQNGFTPIPWQELIDLTESSYVSQSFLPPPLMSEDLKN